MTSLYEYNALKLKILKLLSKLCCFLFFSDLFGQLPKKGYKIIILNTHELDKLKLLLKTKHNKKFHIHLMNPSRENFSLCIYLKFLNKNLTYSFSINYINSGIFNKKILLNTYFVNFKEFEINNYKKYANLTKYTKLMKEPVKILFCAAHDLPHKRPKGLVSADFSRKKKKFTG